MFPDLGQLQQGWQAAAELAGTAASLFLEQDNLYRAFNLDEPWDSSNNRLLLERMPSVFVHPSSALLGANSATHYQVFVGPHAVFEGPKPIRAADIVDGLATTVMVVEASDPVPWTKPADLPFGPSQPLPKLGVSSGGFIALMADGTVRRMRGNLNEPLLRALITRDGHETINPNDL